MFIAVVCVLLLDKDPNLTEDTDPSIEPDMILISPADNEKGRGF